MAAAGLHSAFPSGPLVDPATGLPTGAWRAFFMNLYARTGDAQGASTVGLQVAIDAETNARAAADAELEDAIAREIEARRLAEVAEHNARVAADATLLPLTGGTLSGPLLGPSATFTVLGVGVLGTTWTASAVAPTFAAVQGSLHSRVGGGVGATLYVCQGGAVWLPVAGV
jgi:hypothetical protein